MGHVVTNAKVSTMKFLEYIIYITNINNPHDVMEEFFYTISYA